MLQATARTLTGFSAILLAAVVCTGLGFVANGMTPLPVFESLDYLTAGIAIGASFLVFAVGMVVASKLK